MADTNSYRRISAEATILAKALDREMIARGYTDEERLAAFKVLLAPAQTSARTAFSSAIAKALQPGVVVKLSDEGIEVTDVRNRRVVHNPEGGASPDADQVAKSLFQPDRIGREYGEELLRRSMQKARREKAEDADQHDLTEKIRRRVRKERG